MLTGTLEDIGVVELIQFPNAARKTGELRISNGALSAQLYYDQGNLLHVMAGSEEGIDALIRVVDLATGKFEFHTDVKAPTRSLQTDLHRSIMIALKARDEARAKQAERHAQESAHPQKDPVQETLNGFLGDTTFVTYACTMSEGGELLREALRTPSAPPGVVDLRASFAFMIAAHPRPAPSRVIVNDALGIIVFVKNKDTNAFVVADEGTQLGAVSMAATKLLSLLT